MYPFIHYFIMYLMYIIVLHVRIQSIFKYTKVYFIPTLYHNVGAGDYLSSHPRG